MPGVSRPAGGSHPAAALPAAHEPVPRQPGRRARDEADFGYWLAGQDPFEGYGVCQVVVCPDLAASPLGLCSGHATRYKNAGRPGGASLPRYWSHCFEQQGLKVPLAFDDEQRFGDWCAREWATPWPGQINLRGLRPLLRAEIRWTLFANSQQQRPNKWDLGWVQKLANLARDRDAGSLTGLDLDDFPRFHGGIAKSMLHHLRLIYFTPAQTGMPGSSRPTTSVSASRTAPATST